MNFGELAGYTLSGEVVPWWAILLICIGISVLAALLAAFYFLSFYYIFFFF